MANPQKQIARVPMEDTLVPGMAVLASAVAYRGKAPRIYIPPKPWQLEAYRHYGICGEARFAAQYIANALSRVKLNVVESLKKRENILTDGEAVGHLEALFNGPDGQIEMMKALGLHLTIAGEAYLVGRTIKGTESQITGMPDEVWEVLAVTEVQVTGQKWTIYDRENEGVMPIELGDDDVVIRIWRPHPEKRREADSPFRSMIPVLAEIEWLTRHIFAQCASRLAGAGLLFVSDGVQIAEQAQVNADGESTMTQATASALMTTLARAMMRPLEDPGAPEALVPLIMTVPEDLLKSGKVAELMHFWSDLDEKALEMRTNALVRFADGMDMPAEKLRGLSTAPKSGGGTTNGPNHWGMWQIDEEAITIHIEPLAALICNFLSIVYLRPLPGVDPLNAVWYDTADLRLRPDRSKESIELYNLGLVKAEVVMRENGFNPNTEMMTDEERKLWVVLKIVTGNTSATPEQVAAALAMIGVDVPVPDRPGGDSRGPRAVPSIEDHPTRDLPDTRAAGLLHASEALVMRALERAGNRLRQRGKGGVRANPSVPVYAVHTVMAANGTAAEILADAFSAMAEPCLNGLADPNEVVPILEAYVSTLVVNQEPHTRDKLAERLSMAGLI